MRRFLWAVVVTASLAIPGEFLSAQHCGGKERWAVKDGTDPATQQIDFGNITPLTVAQLLQVPEPALPPQNDDTTRVVPNETHLYRVTARLVKWKKECCRASDDSDYHLVMTDDSLQFSDENNGVPVTGHSFVAELPDPNCLSGRSGHFGIHSAFLAPGPLNFATARQALEQQTQNPALDGSWNEMNGIPVEIIGVGFFDRAHSQTGRSPNNIEIHPILSINFNPQQTTGGTGTTGTGTTTTSTTGTTAQKWEYKLITAASADALLTQANTLGDQGWEMVGVVADTSRPDRFVGYLKRPKQ